MRCVAAIIGDGESVQMRRTLWQLFRDRPVYVTQGMRTVLEGMKTPWKEALQAEVIDGTHIPDGPHWVITNDLDVDYLVSEPDVPELIISREINRRSPARMIYIPPTHRCTSTTTALIENISIPAVSCDTAWKIEHYRKVNI